MVRTLTVADAAEYRRLRLRALLESPEAFGSTYTEAVARPLSVTEERLRGQTDSPDGFTLGAFEGELVGVSTLRRKDGTKELHKADLVGVYVAPEWRGRGVGRSLLAETIARARLLPDLEQVHLTVVTANEGALALYHGLGFESYGIEPRALKEGDRYYDEELMVLRLR